MTSRESSSTRGEHRSLSESTSRDPPPEVGPPTHPSRSEQLSGRLLPLFGVLATVSLFVGMLAAVAGVDPLAIIAAVVLLVSLVVEAAGQLVQLVSRRRRLRIESGGGACAGQTTAPARSEQHVESASSRTAAGEDGRSENRPARRWFRNPLVINAGLITAFALYLWVQPSVPWFVRIPGTVGAAFMWGLALWIPRRKRW